MIKHKLFRANSLTHKQGFTIVEVLVVVATIAILVTIGTFAYINVKKQSTDNAVAAKVAWIGNKLAAYKAKNGEYPIMEALNPGTSSTAVTMTDFSAAASILDVSTDYLSGPNNIKFHTLCASGCGITPQTNQYEYVALTAAANSGSIPFTWSVPSINCKITIDYADPSYVFIYYSSYKGVYIFKKSPQGTASIISYGSGPVAPQTCTFS